MTASKFTDEQKIKAVQEWHSKKRTIKDICDELNIDRPLLYSWKNKFKGIVPEVNGAIHVNGVQDQSVAEIVKLMEENRKLKEENARLRNMYVDAALAQRALEEALEEASEKKS
jgi:transposase-like protein